MRAQTTQILIHTKIGVGIKKTRSFFLKPFKLLVQHPHASKTHHLRNSIQGGVNVVTRMLQYSRASASKYFQ